MKQTILMLAAVAVMSAAQQPRAWSAPEATANAKAAAPIKQAERIEAVSIKLAHIAPSLMARMIAPQRLSAESVAESVANAAKLKPGSIVSMTRKGGKTTIVRSGTPEGDKALADRALAEAKAKAEHARPNVLALPRGIESIAPEDSTGELRVRGTSEGISGLRQILKFLDVPLRKVELEVLSVRLNTADLKSIDVNWMTPQGLAPVGLPRRDAFKAGLQKLLDANVASTLLEVRAIATNSIPSAFSSGAFSSGTGAERLSMLPTVELQLVPTINNDDTITLLTQYGTRVPRDNVPRSTGEVRTVINFGDGETIVLAPPDTEPDSKQVTATFVTARIVRHAGEEK